jgi:hypothetical protein
LDRERGVRAGIVRDVLVPQTTFDVGQVEQEHVGAIKQLERTNSKSLCINPVVFYPSSIQHNIISNSDRQHDGHVQYQPESSVVELVSYPSQAVSSMYRLGDPDPCGSHPRDRQHDNRLIKPPGEGGGLSVELEGVMVSASSGEIQTSNRLVQQQLQ